MVSQRQADELAVQLKERLQALGVDVLAKQSGFVKRKPRKIRPLNFLLGFFKMVLTESNSYRALAISIGLSCCCRLSKQAVHKRLQAPVVAFLELVLSACLAAEVKRPDSILYPNVFKAFKAVYLQDSTTVTLSPQLAKYFPGSRNDTKKQNAMVKIQTVFDLAKESFAYFQLTAFRHNDQKASSLILDIAKAGDLVIRDLGYWALMVIKQLHDKGVYYVSRLKNGVALYEADGVTPLNLLKVLKKAGRLDRQVCVGQKGKVLARLVAIPLPPQVAAERRRKAKANRDRRLNPSKEQLTLLGWQIFITNVDAQLLSAEHIAKLYNLRWRVETVFKSWKSHFHLTNVPEGSEIRVKSYFYAMLIFITIFQTHLYVRLYRENQQRNERQLSFLKLTRFFKEQVWAVILFFEKPRKITEEELEEQIFYHCRYDARADRQNHVQKIAALG